MAGVCLRPKARAFISETLALREDASKIFTFTFLQTPGTFFNLKII